MYFERKNNIYKIIMLIVITVSITFIVTSIGMYNYYNNQKKEGLKWINQKK